MVAKVDAIRVFFRAGLDLLKVAAGSLNVASWDSRHISFNLSISSQVNLIKQFD